MSNMKWNLVIYIQVCAWLANVNNLNHVQGRAGFILRTRLYLGYSVAQNTSYNLLEIVDLFKYNK